ncbi:rRNA maturation RNase YbeY [Marinilongibacter aquaticus]|uniref:rRNA maturation RNase YbeY n=1 Tax=Marinilongibacter aquaticus TaxID=2975157 RepID=UPI0021BD01E3|nr:rRNA maturation RNase YbeY [Marinilongibacter aquaticus]UBM59702.1 rRNA maturation RNase YbeY [Marinilongibacter aquaticus]
MILFESQLEGFELKEKRKAKEWLKEIAESEGYEMSELNYIFMSDENLLEINIEYLDHDTYTDIITFDNSDDEHKIEGDVFISVDRVKENAEKFEVIFEEELRRVMAHGLLHLCGYKDKSESESQLMREKENWALTLYKSE